MRDPRTVLAFDPERATVVRAAPGAGPGSSAGGPRVWYDPELRTYAMVYRERRSDADGGAETCRIARSDDGIAFTDVWEATSRDLGVASLGVGQVVRRKDEWLLYLSLRPAAAAAWRVDLLTADDPGRFVAGARRAVLTPEDYRLDWLKDPFVWLRDDEVHLYVNGPARLGRTMTGWTLDAIPRDATLLAVSQDGRYFPRLEYVFEATGEDSWHGRRARLNSLMPWDRGFVATWDGGRTSYDDDEEWAALATSADGRTFVRLDTVGPWVRSDHGSVRYVQALRVGDRAHLYFESAREDGSHDLRVAVVDL